MSESGGDGTKRAGIRECWIVRKELRTIWQRVAELELLICWPLDKIHPLATGGPDDADEVWQLREETA